jgi:hypothetical protein
MTELTITDLTDGTLDGAGVFDKMMAAVKAHLESEYLKNRIKGPEYATVYLGALQNVLNSGLQFVLQRQTAALQADLLAQQILLAEVEVQKANVQLELLALEKDKSNAEIAQLTAQTALVEAQQAKVEEETLLVPKQGEQIEAQTALLVQQEANAVLEGKVLVAQECKLRAEYDLTVNTNTKTTAEISVLNQKLATEKAQILSMGVDEDSVIGRQKQLYAKQSAGFDRDAEQKAASLMVQSWNTRRMTDEATVADGTNMLNDATVGRAVIKLLSGINA